MERIIKGGIFFTIKDLMLLTGSNSYTSSAKAHKDIREAIAPNKRKLTIREYCNYEMLEYNEIVDFLIQNRVSMY